MFRNLALRIAILYMIVAGLYIAFSDLFILSFVTDPVTLTRVQTYKGLGYVITTGLLLYFLIRSQLEKLRRTDELLKKAEDLNKRLSEINKQLIESEQKRNMFIASMGHELRHPLNLIMGFTSVLLNEYAGKINEEQRHQLQIIKESSKHLLSLINEIIEITKLELTKEGLNLRRFDLRKLIFEIVSSYQTLAEQKNLKIEVNAPDEVIILSDESRLRQVVTNLISNSIKFTDKGFVKIELIDTGDSAELIIQDTGIGMSKEELSYLFQPFSIKYFKNRPDVEGTGLGLFICKRILDLLNGEIKVESKLNIGTRFLIKLPKRQELLL
ncbi:MAG: HAMP domain-containing sensor histidine kinase [candidate division WOR-3 bacterium]